MAGLPGSFGKYFLCEKIAAGGMAEIYLAKLIGPGGFEKQLVVKQISPELGRQRQFVELFVAEAKTLVSLSHGNIVPVYELGVVDETYFIAMEYVDGPPLGDLLDALAARGERLDPALAAHVTAELCKGLDYAHRKGEGVVHRDLSPRNVLLSRDGEVKLVDFGLALAGDRAREGQPARGLPAGSFPYMSPEQVRCEPLDSRSDLFSLGVLLWEMLTGERLFAREDPMATLAAVLSADVPRPSTLRPEVPAELDRVCARALARDRDQRFASAGDILAAVARFAYSVEPPVTQGTLAKVVARVCPPVVRRQGADEDDAPPQAAPDDQERTRPTGQRAAARARFQEIHTFATSAQLTEALANATPLLPFPALDPGAARRIAEGSPRRGTGAQPAAESPTANAAATAASADAASGRRAREPGGASAPSADAAGASKAAAGSPSATADWPNVAAGSPSAAAGSPNVAAESPNVAAGSPNVAARSADVAAESRSVAAESPNVAAGSPSVAAESRSVAAGSPNAAAGSPSVAATSPNVAAGSPDVAAGPRRADGTRRDGRTPADGASARTLGAAISVGADAAATPTASSARAEEPRGRRRRGARGRWALVGIASAAIGATALLLLGAPPFDRDVPTAGEPVSSSAETSSGSGGDPAPLATETRTRATGTPTESGAAATNAGSPATGTDGSTRQTSTASAGAATNAGSPATGTDGSARQTSMESGAAARTARRGASPTDRPAAQTPGSGGAATTPDRTPRPTDGSGTTGSAATAGSDRPASSGSAPGSAPVDGASASAGPAGGGKGRRARGRGTLQVGANPWADVYVDGALVGQAPGAWQVEAGAHAVELRHREARRRFRVSIEPGETASLGMVDFAAP